MKQSVRFFSVAFAMTMVVLTSCKQRGDGDSQVKAVTLTPHQPVTTEDGASVISCLPTAGECYNSDAQHRCTVPLQPTGKCDSDDVRATVECHCPGGNGPALDPEPSAAPGF